MLTATPVKEDQWKIKVSNRKGKRSWRYFTSKQVEKSRVRREIESIPFEERNNVEATIFLIRLNLIGKHQTYCGKLLVQAKPLGKVIGYREEVIGTARIIIKQRAI